MIKTRPLFLSSSRSLEILQTRRIVKTPEQQIFLRRRYEEVGSGWFGGPRYSEFARDAKYKDRRRGGPGSEPRTCSVAAHSKNTGAECRRANRSLHSIPQATAADFCRAGK